MPHVSASAIASRLAFSGFLKYDVRNNDQRRGLRPCLQLPPGPGIDS
jgi:hypothetical protein